MTSLIVILSIILLVVVAVQIGKISELSAKIRGEEVVQRDSDNFNATLGMYFLVGLLVFAVGTSVYYKNYLLGYGPLKSASEHGGSIIGVLNITIFFTGIVFFLTQIALFWFAYKYRGQKGRGVLFIPHDNKLEVIWTAVPAVVMCGLVVGGLWVWNDVMADVKEGEEILEIEATGYQFAWAIRYPGSDNALGTKYFRNIEPGVNDLGIDYNDAKSLDDFIADDIVLPKGKKVRVRITAKDVLHNFYLPHFQLKMDAIPGLPTYFVFTPKMTTEEYRMELKKYPEYNVPADPADPTGPKKWETFNYELACAELCGKGHFSMRKVVKIVSNEEYQAWLAKQKSSFESNIKDKVKPGQYTWFKGNGSVTEVKAPVEFSEAAIESAKEGEILNLKHVNFVTGSAKLTPESSSDLDIAVAAMTKDPNMTIEVGGHTDNVGDPAKNKALSESRAKAVVAYMASKGIDAKRMTGVGYSDTKPIADNATPEGRLTNRRTELKVITK